MSVRPRAAGELHLTDDYWRQIMSTSSRILERALRVTITTVGVAVAFVACGGGDGDAPPPALATNFAVAKANCSPGDKPETGLQGQIPMAERVSGFQGYNCNLSKLSASVSSRGEPIFDSAVRVRDGSGHSCLFGGPAFGDAFGTKVVDISDPNNIVETTVLTTPGIKQPGEGMKANEARGLLVSSYYSNSEALNNPDVYGFDVYDIKTDCRHPQLLYSSTALTVSTANLTPANPPAASTNRLLGHEGQISLDGMTFYVGDVPRAAYHAIDLSDPTNPKYLASFQFPGATANAWMSGGVINGGAHGLAVSSDGNRIYPVTTGGDFGGGTLAPDTAPYRNDGFMVVDTSEIQARRPNPQMRMISHVAKRDSALAQHTIPVQIAGKPYMIFVPEAGSGTIGKVGQRAACAAGLPPFAQPSIYYMGDEAAPKLINNLQLEVNDPKNCSAVSPDMDAGDPFGFLYDSHHCTVDNRDNATTLACGYFHSGIRVFDIRDPVNVKEIAYWQPAAKTAGAQLTTWCAAAPWLDAQTGTVYSRCQDSGSVALKFQSGVWPFPDSTTPTDRQY